jgi:hypothetical protein
VIRQAVNMSKQYLVFIKHLLIMLSFFALENVLSPNWIGRV